MAKQQRICSILDCGKPARGLGYCSAHYQRNRTHGDPLAGGTFRGAPLNWLQAHTSHRGDDCLTWPFARTGKGVANIHIIGRGEMPAARYMCELVYGAPLGEGLQAARSCGKGHEGCVNPSHLRWATPLENSADTVAHGKSTAGERHNMAKLTERDVIAIRSLSPTKQGIEIARMFNVSKQTVSLVLRGEIWKNVQP